MVNWSRVHDLLSRHTRDRFRGGGGMSTWSGWLAAPNRFPARTASLLDSCISVDPMTAASGGAAAEGKGWCQGPLVLGTPELDFSIAGAPTPGSSKLTPSEVPSKAPSQAASTLAPSIDPMMPTTSIIDLAANNTALATSTYTCGKRTCSMYSHELRLYCRAVSNPRWLGSSKLTLLSLCRQNLGRPPSRT